MPKPGFRFKDGKLFAFDEESTCLIESWPSLKALKKPIDSGWHEFVPLFPLVRPAGVAGEIDVAAMPRESFQIAYQRRAAFRAFRSSIPEALAGACERIPARQWTMLKLLQASPHAAELVPVNKAMVFALAHPQFFRERFSTLEGAAIVAKRKQREIAAWVGFSETESAVKILSKVAPESVTVTTLKALRAASTEPHGRKILSHLQRINTGVVAFALEREVCEAVPMSLLEEVSRHGDEDVDSHAALMMQRCLVLGRYFGQRMQRPSSIAKLQKWHLDLSRRWVLENPPQDGPVFIPPLEGTPTIQPIVGASALVQEGIEQNNCVGSYVDAVRSGRIFIYRVMAPERATLAIMRGPACYWVINELKLRSNVEAGLATLKHVTDWLENRAIVP